VPTLGAPSLDLPAEHVVELGELAWPIRHGANDCLSLGGVERHVNRPRGKSSFHLVGNGRIATPPQSADQLGDVVSLDGHAGQIDVAPQRHGRWVSRSCKPQTPSGPVPTGCPSRRCLRRAAIRGHGARSSRSSVPGPAADGGSRTPSTPSRLPSVRLVTSPQRCPLKGRSWMLGAAKSNMPLRRRCETLSATRRVQQSSWPRATTRRRHLPSRAGCCSGSWNGSGERASLRPRPVWVSRGGGMLRAASLLLA
jgi:hypothetical protein